MEDAKGRDVRVKLRDGQEGLSRSLKACCACPQHRCIWCPCRIGLARMRVVGERAWVMLHWAQSAIVFYRPEALLKRF